MDEKTIPHAAVLTLRPEVLDAFPAAQHTPAPHTLAGMLEQHWGGELYLVPCVSAVL